MSDFVIENGILVKYQGNGGDVVIPDGVTIIGCYAFSDCKKLRDITVSSKTQIADDAFKGCPGKPKCREN